jgi:hypothetical protein
MNNDVTTIYFNQLDDLKRRIRNKCGLHCFAAKKKIEFNVDRSRMVLNESEASLFSWFFDRYWQPLPRPYGFPCWIKKSNVWREEDYLKQYIKSGILGPLPSFYGPNVPYLYLGTERISGGRTIQVWKEIHL